MAALVLAAAAVVLVLLAPVVPDEPGHLSGVVLGAGAAAACLAVVLGIALRRRGSWVGAAVGGVVLAGLAVYFSNDALNELAQG